MNFEQRMENGTHVGFARGKLAWYKENPEWLKNRSVEEIKAMMVELYDHLGKVKP
jgi:hypothetical protein